MSKQNPLKEAIQSYLDERAKTDELFAVAYKKKNKSIDECCTYIMGEAKKRGNAVCMSDDEVYIKLNKLPAKVKATSSVPETKPVKLTEEDERRAREEAIKRLAEEQYTLLKKKPSRSKKEVTEVQQMSLF